MFDDAGDDGTGRGPNEAEDGEVVRFGGAAGEGDFVGVSAQERGKAVARVFEGLAGLPAEAVAAGGIAGVVQ